MLEHIMAWLLGKQSPHCTKSDLNRLGLLWSRRLRHLEKAHYMDILYRDDIHIFHERRMEYHAREFWSSFDQEHPTAILEDEEIPQIACVESDRDADAKYYIRSQPTVTSSDYRRKNF